ncbi:MAG: tetratricopeptide repeat protein, partial [Spirochaetota bacterium]
PEPSGRLMAAVVCTMAMVITGTGAFAQSSTSDRNTALAIARVSGAISALSLGFSDEALELVDEALTFAPADPDANYLRAMIGLATGESLATALASMETALAGGDYRFHDLLDAQIMYASLLVRVKRPEDALRFLDGKPADPEMLYAGAIARRMLGDLDGERGLIAEALKRFPDDPRPLVRWLSRREPLELNPANASLLARLFELRPALAERDRRLNILLAPYAASLEDARFLVREFRAMGGSPGYSAIPALRLGLVDEHRAMEELLAGVGGGGPPQLEWPDLEALAGLFSGREALDSLIATFRSFNGIMFLDSNYDGSHEIMIRYESGLPASMTVDDNQDGIPEMLVSFSDGVPASIELQAVSTRLEVHYASWPYASTVVLHDGISSDRYHFSLAVMPLPLVQYHELVRGSTGVIRGLTPSGLGLPSRNSLVMNAYRIERLSPAGHESLLAMDGIPQRSWWQDQYGQQGRTIYRDGLPVDERMDLNGDGVFEARRHWRRDAVGQPYPAFIETDLDSDGIHEYRESLVPPFRKSWDLDGDGLFDTTLETTTLETTTLETSPVIP